MRKIVTLSIFAMLVAVPMLPKHAISAEKLSGAASKNIIKRPTAGGTTIMGDVPVALTVEECTKLGGTVNAYQGACKSGQACQRLDEDGISHSVCISTLK